MLNEEPGTMRLKPVGFTFETGFDEDTNLPVVAVSVGTRDAASGELRNKHLFTLDTDNAVNLGNTLVRVAAGGLFMYVAREYAEMCAGLGDTASAKVIEEFAVWCRMREQRAAQEDWDEKDRAGREQVE